MSRFLFLRWKVIANSLVIIRCKYISLTHFDEAFEWVVIIWLRSKIAYFFLCLLVVEVQIYQLIVLSVLHFCFCGNKFTLVVMFSQFIDKGVEILLQFIPVYIFWRRYILKILCLVMILSSQKFLDYTDLLCFDRDSFN